MDWPLATAYTALFCVTLVYIGHEDRKPQRSSVVAINARDAAVRPSGKGRTDLVVQKNTSSPPAPTVTTKATSWTVPDIEALPKDSWGKTVRQGRDLTVATYAHIGPEVADPGKRFAGSNMSCQSCHLEAGTKQFGLPFVGVFADFPQYRSREGEVGTLEDRINGCMTRSLNGRALPVDSDEMKAFVAYIKFLSTGRPIGAATPGRGSGEMAELKRPADPMAGAKIFAETCAACHGDNGEGRRVGVSDDRKGYEFPPLWGPDSFNTGAGMGRLISAANFIHSNMPNGTTHEQPALSVEDAWDVAAYVESMNRPQKAELDKDFPVRSQKPVDAGYGPYIDGFSESQHRLGPFQPMRDHLKAVNR